MTAGRPPKPLESKALDGTLRADRDGTKVEQIYYENEAIMPTEVRNNWRAKEEWERIAPLLTSKQLLTEVDVGAFTQYCVSYSIYMDCLDKLTSEDGNFCTIIETKDGFVINPHVKIMERQAVIMNTLLGKFGLTPSDRAKLRIPQKGETEKENPRSRYLGGAK